MTEGHIGSEHAQVVSTPNPAAQVGSEHGQVVSKTSPAAQVGAQYVVVVSHAPVQAEVSWVELQIPSIVPPAGSTLPQTGYEIILVERDGTRIAHLKESRLTQLVWELNKPVDFNFTIPASYLRGSEVLLVETNIQIWEQGQIIAWGVPWRMNGDRHNLFFTCEGVESTLARRFVEDDLQFLGIDQLDIAWGLIDYTQTTHGALRIIPSAYLDSGRVRDRTYKGEDFQNIGQALEAFTDINDGFDYEVVPDETGYHIWTPYYPQKGEYKSHMRLEYGKNISDYRYNNDGQQLISKAIVTANLEGDVKIEGSYTDTASLAKYGYLLDVSRDWSGASETSNLEEKARAAVEFRKDSVIMLDIQIPNFHPISSDIFTGDIFPVLIENGATQIDGLYRVAKISFDPPTLSAWLSLNQVSA